MSMIKPMIEKATFYQSSQCYGPSERKTRNYYLTKDTADKLDIMSAIAIL